MLLDTGVDFVVRGEGELTLRKLVKAINEKTEDYSYIKVISFLNDGEIQRNEDRPRIATLDESPLPAINLMPMRKSRWFPVPASAKAGEVFSIVKDEVWLVKVESELVNSLVFVHTS